jgi:phosphatidylcholine synthase
MHDAQDGPAAVKNQTLPQSDAALGPRAGVLRLAAAWCVHVYTASGVLVAFLALRAIGAERFGDAFRWLAVAMVIDCSDGTLARALAVKRVLPWFDGTRLDDIVDYLTYVFVPVVLLYEAHLLPSGWAPFFAAAPLLASAYGFSRSDAKTSDHYFRGFPSYWNVVAFYAFALRLSPAVSGALILVLSLLVFAPLKFLYPSRAPHFRALTLALGLLWGAVMAVAVWLAPDTPPALVWASLSYPAYYVAMSLWLQATGRARGAAPSAREAL